MAPNANRMSPNFGDSARDDRSSSSSLLSTRKYYVKRSLNSMQFAIENSCANNGGDGDGDSLKDCQSVLLAQAKAAQQKSKDKLLARDKQQQQQRTMQKKLWTARKQRKQNKTSSSILDQLVVIEPNPTQTFERLPPPPPPPSLPIPTLSNLPYHLTRGDGSNSTFHTLDGVTTDTVHSMMRKDDVARLARRLHALQKQHQKQLRRHKQTKRQPKRCGTPFRHCTLETYTCGAFWTGGVEEESCIHTRTNRKSRLSPRKESLVANELAALQARLRQLRTNNNKKCVRFEAPLVTKVYTRPKTHPDDIDHLYFQEDELDLLEEDRETVPADKVECHYYNYSSLSSSSSNSQKNAHAHIRVESGVRHPQDE